MSQPYFNLIKQTTDLQSLRYRIVMRKTSIITYHVLVMDIMPTAKKNPVKPLTNISILDIFAHLKQWGYESEKRLFNNHSHCGVLPVITINEKQGRIDILLCLSDKDSDDPETFDFKTNEVRHFDKTDSEGYNGRSHIVIQVNENDPRSAKFAIEYKQGISPRFFVDTLNYFIKDARSKNKDIFKGIHPTERDNKGNAKKVGFKIKFTSQTEFSDEIIKAFESDRVQDVIYHQPIHTSSYDGTSYTPKRQDVHMGVKANIIQSGSKTLMQKTRDVISSFEKLLVKNPGLKGITFTIKFKNKEGKNRTAYYHSDTHEFSLAKKSFIRRQNKNPKELALNQSLCDRMYAHLAS